MPRRHTYVTLSPDPAGEDLADALRSGAALVRVDALTRPTSRMCLTVRSTAFSGAQEKAVPCPCHRHPLPPPPYAHRGRARGLEVLDARCWMFWRELPLRHGGLILELSLRLPQIWSRADHSGRLPRQGLGVAGLQCALSPIADDVVRHRISLSLPQSPERWGITTVVLDLGFDCFPALPPGSSGARSSSRPSSSPRFLVGSV
jgi:hypothetical protein